MPKNYKFHVISNTHWDREWRYPFQRNRQKLVEMIDQTLDILDRNPDYRAFHLDSQTIVLKDYLEIRPQKREQVEKFIRERRLLVGPWYILPEEFQVGGENLVRNLLLGHRIAREFGHVMKVGYSPFSWGQISQLPQIYKEFGIDVIMFYRGVNSLDSPKAEFIWEGADGTRTLTSRFSTMPRYNFYFYIYRPVVHNEKISDVVRRWTRGGLPFHFTDPEPATEDYALADAQDEYYPENVQPSVESIIQNQIDDFTTDHIFWAEGHDTSGPNEQTVRIIKDINKVLTNGQAIHSTLEDYADGLKTFVDLYKLTVVKGERRSSQFDRRSGNMYGYTTSARMFLKQANFLTEKWLQFYAEPFNLIAGALGLDIADRYIETAWNLLLQNSAHDSIGGCSLDEIHADGMNRYKQATEISQGVFDRAWRFIVKQIDLKNQPADDIFLVVVNPMTFLRNEIIETFIDIPQEMDAGNITIQTLTGKEISFQLIDKKDAEPVLEHLNDRPMYFRMKRYHGYLFAENIQSMGYSTLKIVPSKSSKSSTGTIGRIEKGLPVLENKHLRIDVQSNGTFDVLDKTTGKHFNGLGYFANEGEAGHAWTHIPIDPVVDTKNSKPVIDLIENGELASVARIHHELEIPAELQNGKRSDTACQLPIDLKIVLRRDSSSVELDVDLDNRSEDHRLRLMFPTDIDAEYSWGEGQFDVVKRTTKRADTSGWIEQPMVDYPLHHFVDVSDGQTGAAIFVDGLKEYEVLDDARTTLAITLFRAFSYVIQPSSVQDYSYHKGSQCLGKQTFRLAFMPHAGDWQTSNVYRSALAFNNELKSIQIGRATGKLNPELSFLSITPESLIFSALKSPETASAKSLVLRLYNPTESEIRGKVRTYFKLTEVRQITLEEIDIDSIPLTDTNSFQITVPAKKIQTFMLEIKE